MIKNPVLTGFHADPSMICVDGTFYVANSTFEYFPGVRISASKDLANWEVVSTPLDRTDYLNMRGNVFSGGIWAPCLSYCDGIFYLVFTDVKTWKLHPFKDCHNYITTARDIKGPWTEPVYMNSIGFDTSLFHDDDGRKYFLNMEWDFRQPDGDTFTGILLTEVDPVTFEFIGETKKIFTGTDRKLVEGPHLYKKDGWYYLLTAEGGTFYEHAATVCRSRNIFGPYELHPKQHIMSAWGHPENALQKTGHSSWAQGPDGRWFTAFLCGRPVGDTGRCILGRETAINEMVWEDDWPYLKNKTLLADEYFEGYGEKKEQLKKISYEFGSPKFFQDFQTLRGPIEYALAPDNTLRIYGAESPFTNMDQALYARRQTDVNFRATTCVEFKFKAFQQFAALVYRYDEEQQYIFKMAYDERVGSNTVSIYKYDKARFENLLGENEIPVDTDKIWLRVTVHGAVGKFSYSLDGEQYEDIDMEIDATILSDDYVYGFTGAFVGMAAYDLKDRTSYADFKEFTYEVLDE